MSKMSQDEGGESKPWWKNHRAATPWVYLPVSWRWQHLPGLPLSQLFWRNTVTAKISTLEVLKGCLGGVCMSVCVSRSIVSDSAIPWTVAHQAPLSMGFPRQKYWSGIPCPPPGDLPNLGDQTCTSMSPALAGRFFTTSATWETLLDLRLLCKTQECWSWTWELLRS